MLLITLHPLIILSMTSYSLAFNLGLATMALLLNGSTSNLACLLAFSSYILRFVIFVVLSFLPREA